MHDCGIYLLENARRLSQNEPVNGKPIDAERLRVFFAELLLARSSYEASEQNMLKSLLYPESLMAWQVGAAARSYAFPLDSTRPKRRKLEIEAVEAQATSANDSSSSWSEDDAHTLDLADIKAGAGTLFKSSPSCPWMKYLERFANCRIQRNNTRMGYSRAFRLLQMVAAFGCPEHFVALKGAVAQYRVLGPESALKDPLDLPSQFYKVGLWTERLGLINVVLQRLARAHFTSLIDDGKDLFLNRSLQTNLRSDCAINKAVKAVVIQINPRMAGWDTSHDLAKKSAFLDVQRNLRRWRREGVMWSLIQKRFSSLALLVLAPHHIRLLPATRSVSESS